MRLVLTKTRVGDGVVFVGPPPSPLYAALPKPADDPTHPSVL